tara:strand:+ start:43 stop:279 length:237 start_codon:yes stop_codon:yes gene_type:complete
MNKHIIVKDKYRTNPLSLEPGGKDVTVIYDDGFQKIYTKVKYPKAFIKKIHQDGKTPKIIAVLVDGKSWQLDWLFNNK